MAVQLYPLQFFSTCTIYIKSILKYEVILCFFLINDGKVPVVTALSEWLSKWVLLIHDESKWQPEEPVRTKLRRGPFPFSFRGTSYLAFRGTVDLHQHWCEGAHGVTAKVIWSDWKVINNLFRSFLLRLFIVS